MAFSLPDRICLLELIRAYYFCPSSNTPWRNVYQPGTPRVLIYHHCFYLRIIRAIMGVIDNIQLKLMNHERYFPALLTRDFSLLVSIIKMICRFRWLSTQTGFSCLWLFHFADAKHRGQKFAPAWYCKIVTEAKAQNLSQGFPIIALPRVQPRLGHKWWVALPSANSLVLEENVWGRAMSRDHLTCSGHCGLCFKVKSAKVKMNFYSAQL